MPFKGIVGLPSLVERSLTATAALVDLYRRPAETMVAPSSPRVLLPRILLVLHPLLETCVSASLKSLFLVRDPEVRVPRIADALRLVLLTPVFAYAPPMTASVLGSFPVAWYTRGTTCLVPVR